MRRRCCRLSARLSARLCAGKLGCWLRRGAKHWHVRPLLLAEPAQPAHTCSPPARPSLQTTSTGALCRCLAPMPSSLCRWPSSPAAASSASSPPSGCWWRVSEPALRAALLCCRCRCRCHRRRVAAAAGVVLCFGCCSDRWPVGSAQRSPLPDGPLKPTAHGCSQQAATEQLCQRVLPAGNAAQPKHCPSRASVVQVACWVW